jgi:beta-galactosidase/beta-glucuronidase
MNMTKKSFLIFYLVVINLLCFAQNWQPAGDKIKTEWAEKVDPANPLPEYPRPMMVREQWKNLNGLWDYAILLKGSAMPATFDGKILVPFAVESSLSGVQKPVGGDKELWYSREFDVPASWKNKQILLNFGAVDWKADVWINDIQIGSHKGGYTPFSFVITPFLTTGKPQKLMVRVWDPADEGFQPRGKQVSKPGGIWYTSVTGIWQTVWIEPVSGNHLTHIKSITNIDGNTVTVTAFTSETKNTDLVEVKILDGNTVISSGKGISGSEVLLSVPEAKLWSPETPFLYDLKISLLQNGKVVDEVKSYFGMRKISTKKDENGIVRLQLNNKDYFQFGPLDQGWWPDGLYTAPTDEALKFDIVKTKEMGFNLIRKHVKVEPARWYYHCDREGILVWQDMPSGDGWAGWQTDKYFTGTELVRSPESEENFKREWMEIMDLLISNPCIVTWVPFNEAWGQFKTVEICQFTKSYDPSRLVNPASGGNFFPVGDMLDIHHYPEPEMTLYDGGRANVLGEFGGIGLVLDDHLWIQERNWGYVKYKNSAEATDAYLTFIEQLKKQITQGFSAAIYTQTTDVEIEINGLMTYDRKVVKLDESRIKKANQEVCNWLKE